MTILRIGRALNELGVRLIIANSPQAKGRIERLFKTFQDRLLKELKLNVISSMEEANKYLHNVFLYKFNKRFTKDPENPESAWRVLPRGINLNSVFSIKEQRTVGSGVAIEREAFREPLWLIILSLIRIGYFRYCPISIESPLLRLK